MFDKNKFAQIIRNIKDTYNSQEEFSKKSGIGRTYLSQYMNMKLKEPPKPKILQKLADASNNKTTYKELMEVCGYSYLTKLDKTSFDISSEYWNMIFGNQTKVDLTPNGSFFLSSLLDNCQKTAERAIKNGKDLCGINLDPDLLIPKTINIDETIEYTKIFCFVACFVSKTAIFTKTEKKQFVAEIKELLNNLPIQVNVSPQYYMCPVYGSISAGQPNWAEESIEGRLPLDPDLMGIVNPEEHFFLRVNGESMNKIVKNGAFALIHKQDIVEDGEIAVVLVNGYDATLKKFSKQGDMVILEPQSNDETFKTQVYDKNTSIKILGKYVGKMEINS